MRWIKKNRTEFILLVVLILLTLGMRLYRIDGYMTFLGDEGRDALMIKRILTTFDIPLIGPPTSIGNMYLGPLYYYMMAVAMAIGWLNPVAAAVMVALIGTATVGLIYYLLRQWFGKVSGVIGAFLYAISPVNITYSRSSWNPNPAPFFALLSIVGVYWARESKNFLYFILSGVALAFAVQMHYLALILVPIVGWLWLLELYKQYQNNQYYKHFWLGTFGAVSSFLFLMSPLLIFDIKHNWINFRAIATFFGDRQTTVNLNLLNTLSRIPELYFGTFIGRYAAGQMEILALVLGVLVLCPVGFCLYLIYKRRLNWPLMTLTSWILVGVAGLSLYKQNIYDHYLGFLNPVLYLLLGAVWWMISQIKKKPIKFGIILGGGLLMMGVVWVNWQQSPLLIAPNNQYQRTQQVADYIIDQSEGKPFNFALLSEHNYDAAYQFVLDMKGHKPLQVPFDITDQLFVVCEDAVCQPVGNPKYEIAAFGWAKVDHQQEVRGVKVFKLVHNNP